MRDLLFDYTKKRFFYHCALVILGLLVFHSVAFKGFLLDDKSQIITNAAVHTLTSLPYFFVQSLHYGENVTVLTGFTYRPITFSAYTVLYAIGAGSPFVFHAVLLTLYLSNAILVFLFYKRYTKSFFAFLFAFIFLVHPVNQEIATYIPDIQDALYFLFGLSALLVVTSKNISTKHLSLSFVFLACACLSKETGIIFVFAAIICIALFQKHYVRHYVILAILFFVCYFLARMYAGQIPFLTIEIPEQSTIAGMNWYNHVLLAPKVLAYYITALIMPLPSLPMTYLSQMSIFISSLSFLFILFCYSGFFLLGETLKKKSSFSYKAYLLFFFLFLLSSLFHSQLIPLDVLISKRWMYVQLFAFLGMISLLVETHWAKLKHYKRLLTLFFVIYICILILETILALRYY